MLISTKTLVTEIPTRAMLDLEEIGGEGLRDSYATLIDVSTIEGGVALIADYEGNLLSFLLDASTTIPVINYGLSNALEGRNQEITS